MTVRQFDARHLSSQKEYQVQLSNWFEIQIDGISESLCVLANTINLPERSNPAIEVSFGNSKAKIAGMVEFADASMTVMDAIVKDTQLEIQSWQDKIYNPETGAMGWVSDYKRDMVVVLHGPDGSYLRSTRYVGVWPSSVSFGELSNESADKVMVTMTLSYDRAYREATTNKS